MELCSTLGLIFCRAGGGASWGWRSLTAGQVTAGCSARLVICVRPGAIAAHRLALRRGRGRRRRNSRAPGASAGSSGSASRGRWPVGEWGGKGGWVGGFVRQAGVGEGTSATRLPAMIAVQHSCTAQLQPGHAGKQYSIKCCPAAPSQSARGSPARGLALRTVKGGGSWQLVRRALPR